MKKILFLLPVIMMCGCSKKTTNVSENATPQPEVVRMVEPIGSRPLSMVLKASAFQMTGDYSNNVAITLNDDGSLAYYPAPSDITANSRPVDLGNGWWLNRQGLSPNSVFTRYTFEEYEKLPAVPSQDELKASVIPGARVSNWKKLSYPASEAMQHLPEIKEELK
ncbi:MAG: hypothetical protein K2K81_04215 [Muribaculaceae bacterium]|nr:hypothetical protein [Muribaculaceae bacterium]MDE6681965.1 hypothetical protein [Muribaculaceae bacterium]